jgi:hypothetical protein
MEIEKDTLNQGSKNFSYENQRGIISGSASHIASNAMTQLCHGNMKTATNNM